MVRARNAGGVLGVCGAASMPKDGRREVGGWRRRGYILRTRAGAVYQMGGAAGRARGLVRGMRAHLRTCNLTSSPVEQRQEEVDPEGLEVRGESEAPTPPTAGLGRALGLRGPVHRRQVLRVSATAGSCCWGQAGHRAHLTHTARPARDEERHLGARQRRGTSSPSPSSRPERAGLLLSRVHGCSPPVCRKEKRRSTAEADPFTSTSH